MNNAENNKRREALNGQRFNVIFYGGWYVIDEHNGRDRYMDSLDAALTRAEARNAGVVAS